MHVASTTVFEGPAPSYEDFVAHLASRLHLVPRFRQKLAFVPYGQGRPVWVDDPHLNLGYHVRHTALPRPGSDEQLRNFAARAFSQSLDRSKPLWEMWLVDGLEGDRFAIVCKSHHCLVDGVSGMDITTVLYDAEPEPDGDREPPQWLARPEPNGLQLLADALTERATQPAELLRGVRALLRRPRQALAVAVAAVEATGAFAGRVLAAPDSPLNLPIGAHRRFATVSADLSEIKRIKAAHGGTVNDVILSAVTGALGSYLRSLGHPTDDLELVAMVPVSVRPEEAHGNLGNQVSAMMAPLPVWCRDPVRRLHIVSERMGDLKRSRQAVGAKLLTELTDFAPPTIVHQAARLQSRQHFFNLVVTNVPGPQFPLYVLGRRMLDIFPMVPLAKNQAVCVGIMSYDGKVDFGLVGDYEGMTHLDSLAEELERALDELGATAAAPSPSPTPSAEPARSPAEARS